jgi:hypothetical protein
MSIADRIPTLDDKSLANLLSNASRLGGGAEGAQQKQAAELLPLIEAEIAARLASKPTKAKPAKAKLAVARRAAPAARRKA